MYFFYFSFNAGKLPQAEAYLLRMIKIYPDRIDTIKLLAELHYKFLDKFESAY